MHPKFGPFAICALTPDKVKCTIVNFKQEYTFTFKINAYLLDCQGMDFGLNDAPTYSLLCLLTSTIIGKRTVLQEAGHHRNGEPPWTIPTANSVRNLHFHPFPTMIRKQQHPSLENVTTIRNTNPPSQSSGCVKLPPSLIAGISY